MKPCEIIASHTEAGQVIPLKIKVREGDESQIFAVKSFVELSQAQQKNIRKYRCKIVVNDTIRQCELLFYINETRWVLTNIK